MGFFSRALGPGLITGASDDDPSGIATYSQVGAQLGFGLSWTLVLTFPLMAAIQEISGRLGRITGKGIAGNIRRTYPAWLLHSIVCLVVVANTINIGADLGAMGDAVALLAGGPRLLYVAAFGIVCGTLPVFMRYAQYAAVLRWLSLTLLAYLATLVVIHVPWGQVAGGLIPHLHAGAAFWSAVVAIFGTTISPYLFFWQASQEVEDIKDIAERQPLIRKPSQAPDALKRIRVDTVIGMAFSNVIALAILITAASELHRSGIQSIETSAQAALALRPIAGPWASALFSLGIIGTGLLAVPVLAGSAAYALGEARGWRIGLSRLPKEAQRFYFTIAIATLVGVTINLVPIAPLKALYWAAVINGVVAVPVMFILMRLSANTDLMGKFVVAGALRRLGWIATLIMALAAAIMLGTAAQSAFR